MALGKGCSRPLQPSACLVSLLPWCSGPGQILAGASARLTRGFDSSLFRPSLGHSSLPLASPLGVPFATPALASGDAGEGAVAGGAWLGRRDPRRQLGQHGEHRLHPLWICMYSVPHPWPALCTPAHHALARCNSSICLVPESSTPISVSSFESPLVLQNRVGQPQRPVGQMRLFSQFSLGWGIELRGEGASDLRSCWKLARRSLVHKIAAILCNQQHHISASRRSKGMRDEEPGVWSHTDLGSLLISSVTHGEPLHSLSFSLLHFKMGMILSPNS